MINEGMIDRKTLIGDVGGTCTMVENAFFHSSHGLFFSTMIINVDNLDEVSESKRYIYQLPLYLCEAP